MGDLTSVDPTPENKIEQRDDLLSILNREAEGAIQRIAEQLNLSQEPPRGPEASSKYRLVCQAYEARRQRTEIFDADLFADPAWDILLASFREHLAVRPFTLGDAIAAADVPPSTGARWVKLLERRGLLTLRDDRFELTSAAILKLEAYMERLRTKSLMRVI